MKAKNLTVYAGLCAGVASMAAGQTVKNMPLEATTMAAELTPARVCKVALVDGKIERLTDWIYPGQGNTRSTNVRIFDCFGDTDSDGSPDGADVACTGFTNPSTRWYGGSAYCNLFFANDMIVEPGTDIANGATEYNIGMFFTAGGAGTTERLGVVIFTEESEPCDPNSMDYYASGWWLDYSTQTSGVGRGWFNLTVGSFTAVNWPLPSDGAGAYLGMFIQEITVSGTIVWATCSQPMTWATDETTGDPNGRGDQTTLQFDDDYSPFFSHTSSECYSYVDFGTTSYGCNPGAWGAALQFFGNLDDGDPCLDSIYPNCDGNSTINALDFLCFLQHYGNGDPEANCDGNSTINALDWLCFLGAYGACQP